MKSLINPYINELLPYQPGKSKEELLREYHVERVVKLASNENPFPLQKNVADAIFDEMTSVGLYPDSDCFRLRHVIAEYNKIGFENVVTGAGLVEIIKMLIRVFLKPGEKVLTSEKTFTLYRIATIENQGHDGYVEAKMDEHYRLNLENIYQLIDEQTKMIVITNPNNPTGTILGKEEILGFINRVPDDIFIILDNAYHEYVNDVENYLDGIDLALNRRNVIVLRTFSKIYAIAGLRVGYAIANPEIISYLCLAKSPFSVSNIAQRAAIASLENDDFRNKSAEQNKKNRERLFQQLSELGINVIPSDTNFLFFVPEMDVYQLNRELLKEGVIIRTLNGYGAPEGMRVTVGLEEDNNFFIQKLTKILQR